MTKHNTYKFGTGYFRCYYKTAGNGWEVGVYFHGKTVFVGNFVHRSEATKWWSCMNKEIRWFCRTYRFYGKTNYTFYGRFISNHLYKTYYKYLDKWFAKYNRTFTTAYNRDVRKYRTYRKNYTSYAA